LFTPMMPCTPTVTLFPYTTLFRSLTFATSSLVAQQPAAGNGELTIQRIFRSPEFRSGAFPTLSWLSDGVSYVELRPNPQGGADLDRKSTRLNSSHVKISYAVFCLK